jgi:hypothetical protein
VEVGSIDVGTNFVVSGKIARAAVIASTDPTVTPSVDFDARAGTPGVSTFTASTGEVWTANGNTAIEGGHPVALFDEDGPLGIRIEEARTNIQIRSEDIDNAVGSEWTSARLAAITANYGITSDGSKTSYLLTSNDAAESSRTGSSKTVSSGVDQVVSWEVKNPTSGWCHILVWNGGANGARQWFDIANGKVGSTTTFGSGFAVEQAWIEPLPNGWYRISVRVSNTGTTALQRINLSDGDSDINSAVNDTIEVAHPQHESGVQFPTTYIPTTSSSATRNADVLTYSATGNADSFPMTVSAEVTPAQVADDFGMIVQIDDGSATDRVQMLGSGTNNYKARHYVQTPAGGQSSFTSDTGPIVGETYTATMVVATNDGEGYIDGVSFGTDTVLAVPTGLTTIRIGSDNASTVQPNGHIRNVKMYNRRLNDTQVSNL